MAPLEKHKAITRDDRQLAARVAAAHAAYQPADYHCQIEAGVAQDSRDHRRRRGFAMTAGDGDAELLAHQLGQELAATNQNMALVSAG